MANKNYFPVAKGNSWTYKMKDGQTYTNLITEVNGNEFVATNDFAKGIKSSTSKIENDWLMSDVYGGGKMQQILKLDGQPGDTWEVSFHAHDLDSATIYTVKEIRAFITVEEEDYENILIVEATNTTTIRGKFIKMDHVTTYYYAADVGLILSTLFKDGEIRFRDALISYTLH